MNNRTTALAAQQFLLNTRDAKEHIYLLTGDDREDVLIITADDDGKRRKSDDRIWDRAKKGDIDYKVASQDFEGPHIQPRFGRLSQLRGWIEARQALGCGVFILVQANRDDPKRKTKRQKDDIATARAVWHEDDTVREAPRQLPLPATFVVESSPGKHHSYFCLETLGELTLDDADGINQRFVTDHEGDTAAKDRSRYLRLAGSWNLKPGRAPFQCRLICDAEPPFYMAAQLIAALPPLARPKTAAKGARAIDTGAPLPVDAPEVLSALEAIRDRCEGAYGPWLEIGMALNHWGGASLAALGLWEELSPDPDECAAKWASFGARDGVTIATVFHLAKEAGWKEEDGQKAVTAKLKASMEAFAARGSTDGTEIEGETDKERDARGFRELVGLIAAARLDDIAKDLALQEIKHLPRSPSIKSLRDTLKAMEREIKKARREDAGEIIWHDLNSEGGVNTTSVPNVRAWLKATDRVVRFEAFSRRVEVDGKPLDDQQLFAMLSATHDAGLRVTTHFLHDALSAIATSDTYDALTDYLDTAAAQWDGEERVRYLCEDYLNADVDGREDVHEEISRTWLLGAVGRAYEPGCKFDNILVLQSAAQGWGKSSMFLALAPRSDWLMQGFKLGAPAKEIIEDTAGKWLVDAGELAGMRSKELDQVKEQLTKTEDTGRVAFGRVSGSVKRRFISGGTTNNKRPLKDDQNRRFMCVQLAKPVAVAAIAKDRDQLWGEAVHIYRAYVREHGAHHIQPDPRYFDELAEIAEEVRETSSMEDALRDRIGSVSVGYVRSVVVAKFLDLKHGRVQDYTDMKSAMAILGFEYHKAKRVGGRTTAPVPLFTKGDWNAARNHNLHIELIPGDDEQTK